MLRIRPLFPTLLCIAAGFVPCAAQSTATFQTKTSSDSWEPYTIYSADVNNDGTPDVVQISGSLPGMFAIYLGNGDGTFKAGDTFTFPTEYQGLNLMASGDFNGDGKVDLVFGLSGTNQLAVFLGKGDGTFQAPAYETIALPSGYHFGGLPIATADYTGDGKLDLITESNTDSAGAIYLIPGNGDGTFGTPATIYTPPANYGVGSPIATGDFDADGKADVAFLETYNCNPGGCASIVHVMYGNGAGGFTDSTPYSSPDIFNFSTGDVDSDGHTDIYGVSGQSTTPELTVLYGQGSRTLKLYTEATGTSSSVPFVPFLALADYNGDGRMDIVGLTNDGGTTTQLEVFLANDSLGSFTREAYSLPVYEYVGLGNFGSLVVGDFNKDTKPDALFVGQTNAGVTQIVDAQNKTSDAYWGACTYPGKGMGIQLCIPTSSTTASPVRFAAMANSYGQLRKIELWVDGKKISEQWHAWEQRAWFQQSSSFSPGSHTTVIYAADVDNRLQHIDYNFTVVNCSAPGSAGVHVCSPGSGATVSSPVQALAAADVTGTIERMEVWVDGVKEYSSYSSTALSTSLSLSAGKHRFDYYAVNTAGEKWETTIYATVK